MPLPTSGQQVANNLVHLAKGYKTSDPIQYTSFRKAFKDLSKNDLSRVVVYLMEVVGSNDVAKKYLEGENKDLRELLKLNNIDPDAEVVEDEKVDAVPDTNFKVGAQTECESSSIGNSFTEAEQS